MKAFLTTLAALAAFAAVTAATANSLKDGAIAVIERHHIEIERR